MQAGFLKRALEQASAPKPKTRKRAALVDHCTLFGTLVAAVRSARNIKYTIAPLRTQPGLGGKTSGCNAYRDGDILMLQVDDEFEPVSNLAEEPFSATQFVRGNEEIKLKFGDLVKMHGVHAKRSGDRTYVNCRLVEKWAALPDWDLSTPDIQRITTTLKDDPEPRWTLSEMKKTKANKPYCRLDIGEHKIMLWKENIDRIIELTSGFVIPNYDEIDLRPLLTQCELVYWTHGSEGNLIQINKSCGIGFDPEEMVAKVLED